ncbi:hypothetical protein BT69DRAFT_1216815 [Atractiella rhizophila]|nr:hypothetical protein BT69DRAFT_1216815 [Atractiella rhizophila]
MASVPPALDLVEKGEEGDAQLDASTGSLPPDTFDPRYATTRKELWSYYCYYIGNNGLSLFNFAPTAFQNLLYQAAESPALSHNPLASADNPVHLPFAGGMRTPNSVVLLANGISFAIQSAIFLIFGSWADFGTFRPNILIFWSIFAYAIGFGWLGVHTPEKWKIGAGLYICGLIGYQVSLTFWTAAFPGLARNTEEMRAAGEKLRKEEITRAQYDGEDMMQRNRIANVAFWVQSVGEIFILCIIVGIMFGVNVNASVSNNNWGLSVLVAFASGVWLLVSLPWFFFERRRPGLPIPPNKSIFTVGFWNLWQAAKQIIHLKQSVIYLVGYFLLGDSLNTTVTVIATLQNEIVYYNTLQLTYLLIVGIGAQAIGIAGFWLIQKRYKLTTKTMFNAVIFFIVLLDLWGMIGAWTTNFGFHHKWEVWAYQAYYGLLVCPWYTYSQIMISEVTPRGQEFLFFSLFSIIGKTSSFIGPIVSSAIIDRAVNNGVSQSKANSMPFYFLFALTLLSAIWLVWAVDLKKAREEQERWRLRIETTIVREGEQEEKVINEKGLEKDLDDKHVDEFNKM